MLKKLIIKKFTVFTQADFEFSPGLNILVGENGTGKSHVLKIIYALIAENNAQTRKQGIRPISKESVTGVMVDYANKLVNVFRADSVKSLMRVDKSSSFTGGAYLSFKDSRFDCSFTHRRPYEGVTSFTPDPPGEWMPVTVAFIPTRELLTIYPGFASLYETRYLQFEETYYDTCLLLGEPLLKKPMADLLLILESAMNGKTELDRDRFYFVTTEQGKIEMHMVAEGIRKLAMLAQLIAVGALQKGGYLFWDEPEANLNPRLIKVVASVIHELSKMEIQIFIATHSLFLLRELEVLQGAEKKALPQRYFALKKSNGGVELEQGDSIEDINTLVVLDEELLQSDRYMALES
ncbi:MAG: AAA family ATPase [Thiolinea sp.]